ncbi:hypothetical protein [Candidatus Pelagibacter sp. HIMB1321]|uniref:hypothetical protein n=1 Tax=Candidatus Pelagibacter sp. HIMB1321 TaxID=1388755 RepID=UPI000A081BD1|nr:hypothetical protein [Candidatus Pelagibacter sp. HIMB1321]SMF79480.1 hypothetical protein SAMN02744631_1038 [Candidatus Pelagibacter sp. HIMB1321]
MNFLKKTFSINSLLISISLFLYTIYRAEFYWDGSKNEYYKTYYAISLFLIIFSISTFFINQKIKKRLIILIFTSIIVLYFVEGAFLLNNKINKFPTSDIKINYKNKTGKDFDTRYRVEIYSDLKKINNNIKMKVAPSNHLHKKNSILPLSGFSNSKTIYDNENGYFSIYQSDRYGFNNPDNEWESKEIEFLLVGDSFTHGSSVNRPFDIASQLRKLSKKSVLNLGYDNNGPLIEYATLREYLEPNVKNIIWIFDASTNFKDLNKEYKNKILKNYLTDLNFTQELKAKQGEVNKIVNDEINKRIKKASLRSKIIKFLKLHALRNSFITESKKKIQPQLLKKILYLANQLSIQNNSKLYFVYLPKYQRYKSGINNDEEYYLIKDIVQNLKIPFIDIHEEVFIKEKDPLKLYSFSLNFHYTKNGYKKVSESIYRNIKEKNNLILK